MRVTDESRVVDLELFEHARTDKAILVSDNGDNRHAVWLLLSQITIHKTDHAGIHDIVCPEWLAIDKGLV